MLVLIVLARRRRGGRRRAPPAARPALRRRRAVRLHRASRSSPRCRWLVDRARRDATRRPRAPSPTSACSPRGSPLARVAPRRHPRRARRRADRHGRRGRLGPAHPGLPRRPRRPGARRAPVGAASATRTPSAAWRRSACPPPSGSARAAAPAVSSALGYPALGVLLLAALLTPVARRAGRRGHLPRHLAGGRAAAAADGRARRCSRRSPSLRWPPGRCRRTPSPSRSSPTRRGRRVAGDFGLMVLGDWWRPVRRRPGRARRLRAPGPVAADAPPGGTSRWRRWPASLPRRAHLRRRERPRAGRHDLRPRRRHPRRAGRAPRRAPAGWARCRAPAAPTGARPTACSRSARRSAAAPARSAWPACHHRKGPTGAEHAHGFIAQTVADLGARRAGRGAGAAGGVAGRRRPRHRVPAPAARGRSGTGSASRSSRWRCARVVFGLHSLVDWAWFVVGPTVVAARAPPGSWPGAARSAPRRTRAEPAHRARRAGDRRGRRDRHGRAVRVGGLAARARGARERAGARAGERRQDRRGAGGGRPGARDRPLLGRPALRPGRGAGRSRAGRPRPTGRSSRR